MSIEDDNFDRMAGYRSQVIAVILGDEEVSDAQLEALIEAFHKANDIGCGIVDRGNFICDEHSIVNCVECVAKGRYDSCRQLLGELCSAMNNFYDQSEEMVDRHIVSLRSRSKYFDRVLREIELEGGLRSVGDSQPIAAKDFIGWF